MGKDLLTQADFSLLAELDPDAELGERSLDELSVDELSPDELSLDELSLDDDSESALGLLPSVPLLA